MKKISLKINSKIKVQAEDGEYSSNVQDVTEECIAISIPVNNGSYLSLKAEDTVSVVYYDERELYKFNSKVLRREKSNVPIIIIEQPRYFEKIQRRNYVRINHVLEAYYLKIEKEIEKENREKFFETNRDKFEKVFVLDVSGGGCKIKSEKKMDIGEVLFFRFMVENEYLNLMCRVVRVIRVSSGCYECGIAFYNMDDKTRENIITYIFTIMRQQRKKGLKG